MRKRHLIAALAGAAMAAACTSTPEIPAAQISTAQDAIRSAERAGAARYAAAELALAREKVNRAQSEEVLRAGNALREAEQAEADARLAEAKANAARANLAVDQVERSLQALREEARRSTPR